LEKKINTIQNIGTNTVYDSLTEWLMSGDPSIRFQTARDLLDGKKDDIRMHRMYIELEGWGKQLLDLQDADGTWGKTFVKPEFTATIWPLTILRRIGLERDNQRARNSAELLLGGLQSDGGIRFDTHENSEVCISAIVLANASYFRVNDKRRDAIFEYLIESQMNDKGWNCRWKDGATHSSFHTTLLVLEALREFSRVKKEQLSLINDLTAEGNEFLLAHSLFLSHNTGEVADNALLEMAYPEHWRYDVLSALDYFQSISHPYDIRFTAAIDLIKLRENDGFWFLDKIYDGDEYFVFENPGEASRWITLKVARVLKWWTKVSKFKN
jgi:hypothetical protein